MPKSSGTSSVPTSRDQRDVVAQQVDDHAVFGLVLRIVGAGPASRSLVLLRRRAARRGALHRMRLDPAVAVDLEEQFRRARQDAPGRRDRPARRSAPAGARSAHRRPTADRRSSCASDRKGQVRLVAVALRADAGAAGRSASRSPRTTRPRAASKIGPLVGGGRSLRQRMRPAGPSKTPRHISGVAPVRRAAAARASARADSRPRRRNSRPATCPAVARFCAASSAGEELVGRLGATMIFRGSAKQHLVAREVVAEEDEGVVVGHASAREPVDRSRLSPIQRFQLVDQPARSPTGPCPRRRDRRHRGRRAPAVPNDAWCRRPQHVEILLLKAALGILVDGVERVHQAVAEGIGIDVERRVDEVRDVGPEGLVAVAEPDRRPEALRLHLQPELADAGRRSVRRCAARCGPCARTRRRRSGARPC